MRPSRQILGLLLLAVLAFMAGAACHDTPIDAPGVGDIVQQPTDHYGQGESGDPPVPAEPGPAPLPVEPEPGPEAAEPVPPGPYAAIIIDDFGFSRDMADKYGAVPIPLTWAVIPFQSASSYVAQKADELAIPYLIHMPMGATGDSKWSEKSGVLDSGMSAEHVTLTMRRTMNAFPSAVGMNNHRGSRATKDRKVMETVMAELKERSLLFVDSRTIPGSVAYAKALESGVPALYNSIFLDNQTTESSIREQFRRGLAVAKKRGWVVMIGHTRAATLAFLQEQTAESFPEGSFVTVPQLIQILSSRDGETAAGDSEARP